MKIRGARGRHLAGLSGRLAAHGIEMRIPVGEGRAHCSWYLIHIRLWERRTFIGRRLRVIGRIRWIGGIGNNRRG